MMLMDRSEREFRQSAAIASRALLRAQLLAGQHEITCPTMLRDRLAQSAPIVIPAVRQLLPTNGKGGPVEAIQRLVCRRFGVSLIDLKSKRQSRTYSIPRQAAMYLAKRFTTHSLPEIGRCFGGKDHTTVIWATHATVARRRDDPEFNEKLAWIEAEIIAAGEAS